MCPKTPLNVRLQVTVNDPGDVTTCSAPIKRRTDKTMIKSVNTIKVGGSEPPDTILKIIGRELMPQRKRVIVGNYVVLVNNYRRRTTQW